MTTTSSIFEPELVAQLALMFEQRISFNRLLGLRIASLENGTGTTTQFPSTMARSSNGRAESRAGAADPSRDLAAVLLPRLGLLRSRRCGSLPCSPT